MSLPSSLLAYTDCFDFFEKIMNDPQGGRVVRGTYEEAFNWRQRCHYFRKLHREENKLAYDIGHPSYGKSDYDQFRLTLKQDTEGRWWVYAKRITLNDGDVELLTPEAQANES